MSFLGNRPDSFSYASTSYDHFNGTGSQTVYTLSRGVSANADIFVTVGNVPQDPGVAYYVTNLTTLTFTSAPAAGSGNILVVYRQYVQAGIAPAANTVTATQIAANTIQPYHLSTSLIIPVTDNFIGTGSNTSFTLGANAVSANTCTVTVNGLTQTNPTNYSVSGNIITFTSAPALNANVRVVQHGVIGTQIFPLDGTVTASKIAVGAVTGSALAANSITSAALGPTVNVAVINTFTGNNAVFLDNNGNIGLGTGGLDTTYNKNMTIYGTNTEVLKFGNATTGIGAAAGFDIGHLDAANKSNAYIWNRQTAPILFGTNNTEAMRIDSSGNLLVGVTSRPGNAGNAFLYAGLGVSISNAGATLPYYQTYNSNAGTDLKTWRWGNDNSGNLVYQTINDAYSSATERFRIDSSGNIGIGAASGGAAIYIEKAQDSMLNLNSTSGFNPLIEFKRAGTRYGYIQPTVNDFRIAAENTTNGLVMTAGGSGGVRLTNTATSWVSNSDTRLKNITGTYEHPLDDIAQIKAIKFTWKYDETNRPQVGVSAQSVQKVIPEAIDVDNEGILGVRYTEIIPLLVASIQEQQEIIKQLTDRIAALEAK